MGIVWFNRVWRGRLSRGIIPFLGSEKVTGFLIYKFHLINTGSSKSIKSSSRIIARKSGSIRKKYRISSKRGSLSSRNWVTYSQSLVTLPTTHLISQETWKPGKESTIPPPSPGGGGGTTWNGRDKGSSLSKTQKTSIKSREEKVGVSWKSSRLSLSLVHVAASWKRRILFSSAIKRSLSHPRERWDGGLEREKGRERGWDHGESLHVWWGDGTASVSLPRVLTAGNTLEVEARSRGGGNVATMCDGKRWTFLSRHSDIYLSPATRPAWRGAFHAGGDAPRTWWLSGTWRSRLSLSPPLSCACPPRMLPDFWEERNLFSHHHPRVADVENGCKRL